MAEALPPTTTTTTTTTTASAAATTSARAWLARGLAMAGFMAIVTTWNPLPYWRPEFLAEDGSVFFNDALHRGPVSIFQVYMLNFFVLARAIAVASTLLPTLWVPAAFAWISLLLGACMATTVMDDGYAWIHPNRIVRVLCALTLALVPGATSYGSLCQLSYVAQTWLFLLAMRMPMRTRKRDLCLWFVLSMSTPVAPLVFACLAAFAVVCQRKDAIKPMAAMALPVLLTVISALWDPFTMAPCHPEDPIVGVVDLQSSTGFAPVTLTVERAVIHFFMLPVLGDRPTAEVMRQSLQFWLFGVVALAAFAYWARKQREWWFLVLTVSATFGLAVMGRDYALNILLREKAHTCWDARYSFTPGVIAVLLWTHMSAALPNRRALLLAGFALWMWMNLIFGMHWPFRTEESLDWPTTAASIEALREDMRAGRLPTPQTTTEILSQPPYWKPFRMTIYHP